MNTRLPKNAASALIVIALTGLTACGASRNAVKVRGAIAVETPVCSEAALKAGEGKGSQPIANLTYYIKNGESNDPAVIANKLFTTDENGEFSISLEPGTYAVLHADKLMSYPDFKLKHLPQSTYFKARDNECYQRWYNSPDFLITVQNDTTMQLLVKSRCYTGGNPCLEYTGPKNP